ncbi:hypothetical protein PPACK8108_LOCUS17065 [Phakopsora pachyrhizi]|uniref:Uncharacterized protein n=1 Tax=Phakopsora pachyrhizi TaxID=170000 RepID=A0AAV0BBE2_PHAPC|nr:hypothetical protein PPACK8108_LOCUS17065 [Phakopsora pachyrhizi]
MPTDQSDELYPSACCSCVDLVVTLISGQARAGWGLAWLGWTGYWAGRAGEKTESKVRGL